jgi:hypothetical protein
MAADVRVLASYRDGTPLVLSRSVGQGRVIYLNIVFDWNGWWNAFYAPEREAYRKLFDAIVRSAGLRPLHFLAFESAEPVADSKGWWGMHMRGQPAQGESIAWWASQLYSDPSGRTHYLAVFSDHRSPLITARVQWAEPDARMFELLSGREMEMKDGSSLLSLRPGEGALIAVTASVPEAPRLTAPPAVEAGQPLKLSVSLPGADEKAEYGIVVDVFDPLGRTSRAHSLASISAPAGRAIIEIPTAINDPPGRYRLVATESITRLQAEAQVKLTAPARAPLAALLTPFPERESEKVRAPRPTAGEILEDLRRLRSVYEGEWQGLEAKYMLSYYLNAPFRPDGRHATVRRLQRADWSPHLDAIADAMRNGERFILLGEDLNRDPLTGIQIDPFAADIEGFVEKLARGGRRRRVEKEGISLTVIEIGRGGLVTGSESVDRAAYHSSDFAAWHERLKKALQAARER